MAFIVSTLANASLVWVLLLLLGLATLSILVWLPDLKTPLLALLVFTLPIDVLKALSVETTVYGAGLSLILSDLAFLPLRRSGLLRRSLGLKVSGSPRYTNADLAIVSLNTTPAPSRSWGLCEKAGRT